MTYDDNGDIIPLSERFRTDREGDEAWKNEDIRYSLKPDIDIAEQNIADGNAAVDSLIEQAKTSDDPESLVVENAMYRTGIGFIDLKWGVPGSGAKYKGGYGLSHIIEKRNAETGDGKQTVRRIIQAVARATSYDTQYSNQVGSDYHRIRMHYDGITAVLSKEPGNNHWLLTGWGENKTAANANGEVHDSSDATAVTPTRTRRNGDATVSNGKISQGQGVVNPVSQEISSAGTSIKQIPALFKHPNVEFGETNIDIGGGRFDLATNYLAERGTKNMLFDPYNQSEEVNRATLDYLMQGNKADTVTCANVLNVIAEPDARANVILEAAKVVKEDGKAYFMVYEGDGSGEGKRTGAGWQNNRKTADYMGEIGQYFNSVQRKGKLIIASEVDEDLPAASWETTPGNATRYQQRDFRIDFNVPQLDTKALHEAVKGGEGTVENRFEVKYEKTDSGFAVHITDKDSGKTYDRAETVT